MAIDYPLSYALNDFYSNGGSQALIVRLAGAPAGGASGIAQAVVGGLKLNASSPGSWGNSVGATVDKNNITADVAGQYGLAVGDLFNLNVFTLGSDGQWTLQEKFLNLTVKYPDTGVPVAARSRRVDRVLEQSSLFVAIPVKADGTPDLPPNPPAPTPPAAAPGGGVPAGGGAAAGGGAPAGGGARPAAAPAAGPPVPVQAKGGGEANNLQLTDYLPADQTQKTGIYALLKADIFNLLCIPPDIRSGDTDPAVLSPALQLCVQRRAMLIVDSPSAWSANAATAANSAAAGLANLNLSGINARNAALYFPRVLEADPLSQGQVDTFAPCGIVAGIMARTDSQRGVWKAPAGLDASLNGIVGFDVELKNDDNGILNPLGINCLRSFPPVGGNVVWGARTLRGADQLADDYKYVPVRRLALYLEESLYRGTQWVVFEPNDEPLWAQIRLNVGAFMHDLFVQGAFQGSTPQDAYFVKCDSETTTQNDINLGIVNIVVGYAPLKPAEFVVIQIQQMAGQIAT
jgi:hypothetical protein